ncbi:bacterioferritin [Bacteriovorax sp. BAL6_X]|uniref:bacterioferritin n=1 Tax=Bacteriovorax sp. BAL6_X TaxID=1201290 RepID=UPI0003860618|nr:bacterioferritin [Bacteriovorax sp. BAL6_X]EPZ50947.1 bacterioferritin [Bacteriovorax sp. BAL6_X]
MKGNQDVINIFNKLLTQELSAIDLYFLHSRLFQDMGLTKLFERIDHEKDDETIHATKLIERIIFLEGLPELGTRLPYKPSRDVKQLISDELQYEVENSKLLREAIAICESVNDYVSRDILLELLSDTENDHIDWLETQLSLIDKIGLQNYLQTASESV